MGGGLKHSFVESSSFHDGYNVAIGVFGTQFLKIENNVIHHTVGPGIQLSDTSNSLFDNLVAYSISESTYNVSLNEVTAINLFLRRKLALTSLIERFLFLLQCRPSHI